MMKARADDRRIFESDAKPNVVAMQNGLPLDRLKASIPEKSADYKDFAYLHATYRNAKTFGSLIQPALWWTPLLDQKIASLRYSIGYGSIPHTHAQRSSLPQAFLFAPQALHRG